MNEIPKGYKNTKVGGIPEEWDMIIFDDLKDNNISHSITGGPFGSDLKSEHYASSGVRIIQLQNIGDGKFINNDFIYTSEEKAQELKSCLIYPDDIILAKMADPVARACIIPNLYNKFIMGSDGIRLHVDKNKFDNKFILETINYEKFRKIAIARSTGSTRQRIGLSDLKKIPLSIPPLKEQQKIAEILTTWDSAISIAENLIKEKEELKIGLMQKLLSGEVRFKEFSDEWEEVRLGEIATLKNGYPFKSIDYIEKGKYKIITIGNVLNGKLDLNKVKYIEKLPKNIQQHHILKKKDILMSMTGNVGRVCLVNENNCLLNQRVGYLNTKKDNNFIYSVLNTKKFEKKMIGLGQGGAQPNISKKDIENFKILIPKALQEQQKIADVLSTADKEIELLKKELEELKKQKKELIQKLLTGEVRVKI
jgi:type I restriction enzyme S subunit